jgi:glyoxylase-like metal-dependent hydrolase (beta-lactamase superfamily II)
MAPAVRLGGRVPARMVAHCLLVEGAHGLTLVDSGFGTADLAAPHKRLGRGFVRMMGLSLDPAETAVAQVRALGYDAADVRDIVLTHLDLDHVGGIGDFPHATVHVFADELEAAQHPRVRDRGRYKKVQWAHAPRWLPHRVEGAEWLGFSAVHVLADDVLMVPLHGHTRGHSGVAVRRPSGGWFLHAGDSYFFHEEKEQPPSCPAGLRLFQTLTQVDKEARLENAERVRTLHAEHGPDAGAPPEETVTVFSAHDAAELDALVGVTD